MPGAVLAVSRLAVRSPWFKCLLLRKSWLCAPLPVRVDLDPSVTGAEGYGGAGPGLQSLCPAGALKDAQGAPRGGQLRMPARLPACQLPEQVRLARASDPPATGKGEGPVCRPRGPLGLSRWEWGQGGSKMKVGLCPGDTGNALRMSITRP